MKLRSASASDTEKLFDIRYSVIENHQPREELAHLGITVENIKEMIAGGDYVTTIAEKDEQPVGFTMARISEGYVFACFVRPGFEGQGNWAGADAGRRGRLASSGSEADLAFDGTAGSPCRGILSTFWLDQQRLS